LFVTRVGAEEATRLRTARTCAITRTTALRAGDLLRSHGVPEHEDGFGLEASDDVESPEGFAAWVAALGASRGRCTYRWIVQNDLIVGAIALRHETNEFTMRLGHLGYGIRPSARRRGFASWAVVEMLEIARQAGLERVLLVCETENIASANMIEGLGGIREATESDSARRYWIQVDPAMA
jgi:predicted acetyltransferase